MKEGSQVMVAVLPAADYSKEQIDLQTSACQHRKGSAPEPISTQEVTFEGENRDRSAVEAFPACDLHACLLHCRRLRLGCLANAPHSLGGC